jgi:hypothetical protein
VAGAVAAAGGVTVDRETETRGAATTGAGVGGIGVVVPAAGAVIRGGAAACDEVGVRGPGAGGLANAGA